MPQVSPDGLYTPFVDYVAGPINRDTSFPTDTSYSEVLELLARTDLENKGITPETVELTNQTVASGQLLRGLGSNAVCIVAYHPMEMKTESDEFVVSFGDDIPEQKTVETDTGQQPTVPEQSTVGVLEDQQDVEESEASDDESMSERHYERGHVVGLAILKITTDERSLVQRLIMNQTFEKRPTVVEGLRLRVHQAHRRQKVGGLLLASMGAAVWVRDKAAPAPQFSIPADNAIAKRFLKHYSVTPATVTPLKKEGGVLNMTIRSWDALSINYSRRRDQRQAKLERNLKGDFAKPPLPEKARS